MGKIITATFDDILPGEDGLYYSDLYMLNYRAKKGGKILAPPVREVDGKLLHLDGRHRLLYFYMVGKKEVELFLVESKYDVMREDRFPNTDLNYLAENNVNIHKRWDWVVKFCNDIGVRTYHEHFENLCKEFPFLKSFSELEKLVEQDDNLEFLQEMALTSKSSFGVRLNGKLSEDGLSVHFSRS